MYTIMLSNTKRGAVHDPPSYNFKARMNTNTMICHHNLWAFVSSVCVCVCVGGWVSGWVGVECVCGWGVGVFMCVRMSVCESERESACVLCVNASVGVCGYVRAGARALIYVIHLHEAMI